MKDFLFSKVNKFKSLTDYLEIRVEKKEGILIGFQGPALDNITNSTNFGGCVRAMYKGGWGFVSFNTLDALEEKISLAIRQSKIVGKSQITFPNSKVKDALVKAEIKKDPRKIPLKEKKELFEHYNSLLLSQSNKIQSTQVTYKDEVKTTYFINSLTSFGCLIPIESEKYICPFPRSINKDIQCFPL